MLLSSYDSFLQGFKPACYENLALLKLDKMEQLMQYPHYSNHDNFSFFFRNEQLKQEFLVAGAGLRIESPLYVRVVGKLLGYAPKAVEFFADHIERLNAVEVEMEEMRFKSIKVALDYCGIRTSSHVDEMIDNVRWYWDTYEHPHTLMVKIKKPKSANRVIMDIPYRDEDALHDVYRESKQTLEKFYPVVIHT